jgi:5'-nucleotidase
MNILISNDDGYSATGIRALAAAMASLGTLTVVAPDRNRSGASNSLSLEHPVRVRRVEPGWYAVNGTPTDCVHLAISGFLDTAQDLVLSGINHGANLGDDVLYSGTVAAAIEARHLGLPTLAFSLNLGEGRNFEAAARVARELVDSLLARPLPAALILNVNIPDLPYEEIRGVRATRLGARHRAERITEAKDPYGNTVYWVGAAGAGADAGPGTDFHAVESGYVSVTPLSIDMTHHAALAELGEWLGQRHA